MITPVVHTVDRREKDNNIPRNAMTQNEEYKQANDDDLHGLIYPKGIPRGAYLATERMEEQNSTTSRIWEGR